MKKRTFYTSIITLLVSGLYLIGFGVYGLSKLNYNNDMYVIILLGMLVLVFGVVSYIENRRRVF
jgi:cytochrome c biogenesis protein CcdA